MYADIRSGWNFIALAEQLTGLQRIEEGEISQRRCVGRLRDDESGGWGMCGWRLSDLAEIFVKGGPGGHLP